MKDINKNILLAAGGTGGHLHGAQSVALELDSQGCNVYLLTDRRVESLIKGFRPDNIKEVSSATFSNERVYKWPLAFARLLFGFISSLIFITNGPYEAIGSSKGSPLRTRMVVSSSALTVNSLPSFSKSTKWFAGAFSILLMVILPLITKRPVL